MNEEAQKLKEEIDIMTNIAKHKDPYAFGMGYGRALKDIGEFLFHMQDTGNAHKVNDNMIAKLCLELNEKIGEEIKKLI